ncbi:TMV resistance protein N-like isoform X1 [Rosa rugosa]|uniref:TMV resistance protein N-like isoform X1 n=1 Tax=Rosa rugosa TaxID=74645 RepID=UPI002B409325|nr:TMV resistance protein N-like isoform X1 [Rosa rugosa]
MANQAANSSSSTDHYAYEVFLSFRGQDTRSNFTSHLHNALHQKGIKTFIDDELPRGEEISQELLKAIEDSKISIIVFSQNYASSRWCLDELVKILQCRKSNRQTVRPVFYKVDPSDVRHQTGAFGAGFAKLDQCKYRDSLSKWKAALSKAASLSGWTFSHGKNESKFINEIVNELSDQVLNCSYDLDVAKNPVRIESCVQDMEKLLNVDDKNIVRMVGIWGTGGIGKTTIAKAVYNLISHKFESRCFLANVRSKSANQEGLAQLQETLLQDLLREKNLKVNDVSNGVNVIKRRLAQKKVLLILDDVSDLEQLNYLARESNWFGWGSRIVITTRDKHLLNAHQVCSVYEVRMLDDDAALELFSLNAFKRNQPPNNYLKLARLAIFYAQGLPLALIVLGSHLIDRSIEQWEVALDSSKRVPHKKIQDILRVSFDALEDHLKTLFLDIACFFNGNTVNHVIPILEACDLNPVIGIELLKEKALITMDGCKIWMHDLIEEMGKEIVHQESSDLPGERSRLWIGEDVDLVLTNNMGTNKIKGIQVWSATDEICLNGKSFSEMKSLRYFVSSYEASYSGEIDYLSNELRWLDWPLCPLQSFPSNFYPKKLVALNIPDSRITRLWEGFKNLQSLTSMDLSACEFLTELPDFTGILNLKELHLDGCKRLVEVHHSVGSLNKLVTLNLDDCSNLVKLPREISLTSIETICLRNCERLTEFPKIIGKMASLRYLDLSGSGVKELDPSIGKLIGLKELYLEKCANLRTLPCSIYGLQNVEILDLSGCSKLATFPAKTNIFQDNGVSLSLPKLEVFRIGGSSLLDVDFLTTLDCWETLTELDLSYNYFSNLPSCISKFVNLWRLELDCCRSLREIPELPPNLVEINLSDCISLERYAKSSKMLEHKETEGIRRINLWNCHLGLSMEKMKRILLNNQEKFPFGVVFPGSEVPNWFSKVELNDTDQLSIRIPENLKWENTGLAICAVSEEGGLNYFGADIFIGDIRIGRCRPWTFSRPSLRSTSDHVWVQYIPLPVKMKAKMKRKYWWQPYECRIQFDLALFNFTVKSYGVHLVTPGNETSMLSWLQKRSYYETL